MKAATAVNLANTPTGAPLVQLGPGGTYTTSFVPRGSRLLAIEGGRFDAASPADHRADANTGHAGGNPYLPRHPQADREMLDGERVQTRRSTLIDRLLGIDRVDLSREALATSQAATSSEAANGSANLPQAQLNRSLSEAASAWLAGQMIWFAGAIAMIQRLLAQITVAECRDAVAVATVAATSPSNEVIHTFRPRRFDVGRGRHLVTRVSTSPNRLTEFASIIARAGDRLPVAIDLHRSQLRSHPLPGVEEPEYESHTQATEDSATDSRIPSHARLFADDAGTRRRTRREQGDRLRTRRDAYQKRRVGTRCQQGTLFVHL